MTEISALLFGAAIVVFFSYERFNRASYEAGNRFERLVALVSPNKLRARHVVLRAWLLYVAMLLIIYVVFCAYAQVLPSIVFASESSDIPPIGAEIPPIGAESSPDDEGGSLGIPASVSLGVALAIVGLAPSFPILQRVDDAMLLAAHRFAGIPTQVLKDTDDLRLNAIDVHRDTSDDLNIPSGYWRRMAHYAKAARGHLTAPADFLDDINLIFAVSAWILERRLKLENSDIRDQFEALETDLLKRFEFLKLELDERTNFTLTEQRPRPEGKTSADTDPAGEEAGADDLKRRSWDRVASDVDALAEDMCLMLSLYVEHGLIKQQDARGATSGAWGSGQTGPAPSKDATSPALADAPLRQKHATRQHDLAQNLLQSFLQPIIGDEFRGMGSSNSVPAMLWSTVLIFTITLVWAMTLGIFETELSRGGDSWSFYGRTGLYFAVAFNCFVAPIGVALFTRNALMRAKRWANVSRAHWTTIVPQLALVVVFSWFVSIFMVIAVTFWQVGLTEDNGFEQNHSYTALKGAFEVNALAVLRGSLLALLIVWLLDTHAAQAWTRAATWKKRTSLQLGLIGAVVMALIGFTARLVQSHVYLFYSTRDSLDAIDSGLIFYATLYSTLIGFFVVFMVSEVLASQWHLTMRSERGRRHRLRQPAE
jgi:hypothetical protein